MKLLRVPSINSGQWLRQVAVVIRAAFLISTFGFRLGLNSVRMVFGTRRFNMPKSFSRKLILCAEDFPATDPGSDRFDPVQGLLEQLRKLYLGLKPHLEECCSLAICSPNPREGKSTIAVNLAILAAYEMGQKVVLVDMNMRTPELASLLDLEPRPGVTDLADGLDCAGLLVETHVPGLELLHAGDVIDRPGKLLASGVAAVIKVQLVARGYLVIFDTSSINTSVDGRLVAAAADGVITVVKLQLTKKTQLATYYQQLNGCSMLGVVCNYDEFWIPHWIYKLL
ncbi:MAG: Mrp family chromosome partitioning ATPase [Pseudohongiellaceae bacterium]|jgi:Mrp family chromosome partitioning ATPase